MPRIGIGEQCADALAAIVSAATERGRLEIAQKAFGKIQAVGKNQEGVAFDEASLSLAAALAKGGEYSEACKFADRIESPMKGAMAWFFIAAAYARRDREQDVDRSYHKGFARAPEADWLHENGAKLVVSSYLENKSIGSAVSFADQFKDPALTSKLFQAIAVRACQSGDRESASWIFKNSRSALERIDHLSNRANRLIEFASALVLCGDRHEALAAYKDAAVLNQRFDVLGGWSADQCATIAEAQASLDDHVEACKTLQNYAARLDRAKERPSECDQSLVAGFAAIGEVRQALAIARSRPAAIDRAAPLIAIADTLIRPPNKSRVVSYSSPLGLYPY